MSPQGDEREAREEVDRLIKFAGARRILFLVDRGNLADQAPKESQQYASPYNNFKFSEEYAVQGRTNAASAGCAGAAFVEIVREEFGKGNDFAQKITYRTTGARPKDLINEFRTSPMPRIAVTADMIATGTDIKVVDVVVKAGDICRELKVCGMQDQNPGNRIGLSKPSQLRNSSVSTD